MKEVYKPKPGGVFSPQQIASEEALENLAGSISAINAKLDKLERNQELETRGVSATRPIQMGRTYDYVERGQTRPEATGFHITDRRTSTPSRANFISVNPRNDLPLEGQPVPKTKQIQEIRVDSRGNQSRVLITVPSFENPTPAYQGGGNLGGLYEASRERAEAAPPPESGETIPTRGGIVSLQDSVEGLKRSLDKITGKSD